MKITAQNYQEMIRTINLDELPELLQRSHAMASKSIESNMYEKNDNIKRVVDTYIAKLNEYLGKQQSQPGSKKKQKAPKPEKKKAAPKAKAAAKEKQPKSQVQQVSEVDLEVRFIKRYILLDGKMKTKAQLLTFINSLQRAIEKRQIRKESKYAVEIRHIQNELIKIYNDPGVGSSFTFQFDKKDEALMGKFRGIASSQAQRTSVRLISRYIGIHGKSAVKEKAERLLKAITGAFKTKKVHNDDPYFSELKNIEDNLKSFVNQKKEVLKIDAVTLKGLQGIPGVGLIAYNQDIKPGDRVRCPNGETGVVDRVNTQTLTLKDKPGRAVNKKYVSKVGTGKSRYGSGNHFRGLKGVGDIVSSTELEKMNYHTYGFTGKWKSLIGDPSEPFTLMFWSKPGKGKSSLAIELAHYIASTFNKVVLYAAVEEGFAYTTHEKFARLNAAHPNIAISPRLPMDLSGFDVVFIDSVSRMHMEPADFIALKTKYPDKTFVLIFQAVGDGGYRGSKEWEHEVDVSININDNGYARAEKTRFGGTGGLKVFEGTADQIYKFTHLQDAEKFVANRKNEKLYMVQGDDGKIWVTNRDKADQLKGQGYASY